MSSKVNLEDYKPKFDLTPPPRPAWIDHAMQGVTIGCLCFDYEPLCFMRIKKHDGKSFGVWAAKYDTENEAEYFLFFQSDEQDGLYRCTFALEENDEHPIKPDIAELTHEDEVQFTWMKYASHLFPTGTFLSNHLAGLTV